MLRYFSDIGLTPDAKLTIQQQRPYTDATTITLSGQQKNIDLGPTASNAVWVTTP